MSLDGKFIDVLKIVYLELGSSVYKLRDDVFLPRWCDMI